MEPDPYEILQVSRNAESEVIEAAYRRLARKYHPDVDKTADATRRMREINWAYEILHDPARRKEYDTQSRNERPHRRPDDVGGVHRSSVRPRWRARLRPVPILVILGTVVLVLVARAQIQDPRRPVEAAAAVATAPAIVTSPEAPRSPATASPVRAPWRVIELSQPSGLRIVLETGGRSYLLARKDVRQPFDDFDKWELANEVDLDGDGSNEAIVLHFTGGAHCCFEYYMFGLEGDAINMLDSFSLADASIDAVKDLDGDGIPEIVSSDARLAYWGDLGFANSPFLPLVLCRSASRAYYDCTPSFPGLLRASARDFENQLGAALNVRPISTSGDWERNRAALGTLFSYLRMGMVEEGWSRIRTRCPSCDTWLRRFPADFDRALRVVQPDRQGMSLPLASL